MSALDDLIERLERASAELAWLSSSSALLKREGIELALSYAREAKRDDDNDAKAEAALREYLNEEDQ